MPYDSSYILEGPGYVYVGKSADDVAPDVMPADSVAFGASPGGTWAALGYTTQDGFTFGGMSPERTSVLSGQQRAPVKRLPGNAEETVSFTLTELTLANIRTVAGRGTLATVAAGSGTAGHTALTWTDAPNASVALLIDTFGPDGQPRRYFYPSVDFAITGDATHQIGTEMGVPVTATRTGGSNSTPEWRDVIPAL
jgi:hypothetical protein